MKTKFITLFLALAASAGTTFAEKVQIGDLYYNLDDENQTAGVTSQVDKPWKEDNYFFTEVTIPSSVTYNAVSYSVTSIGNEALRNCPGLTSVIISNSVTSIGDWAFGDCTSLTSVTIPNSVTSIGKYAFSGCTGLTSPVYNAHVFAHMPRSYSGAYSIPEGIESIAGGAFYYCTGLTSVTIDNSVTSIGDRAFYYCTGLTSVTIPNSVTGIGEGAFACCTGLTSVTIPNSVTSIEKYAFWGCTSLTSVTIPNSVTSIGEKAFEECSALTSVTIPNSVTSIGNKAFYNCTSLTDIYATCGDLDRVKQLINNDSRVKYKPLPYTITANATNGSVSVPQNICEDILIATPNYGYHFVQWSDGVTDNPRTIELTQDTTFTAEFAKNKYLISVTCDDTQGAVEGESGEFDYLTEKTYNAVPNYGYHFVRWSDNITSNPRIITITEDSTLTAIFAKNTYNITKNAEHGTISGNSSAEYLDEVTLTVNPDYGYHFTQWSDGVTDNPRSFILTQDTAFTAEFAIDKSGSCGDELALTWTYDDDSKELTISSEGSLNSNYTFGVEAPTSTETLIIEEGVTSVGNSAFANYTTLTDIYLASTIKRIYEQAFYNCENLENIYCYRAAPCVVYSDTFDGIDKFACTLHVPAASIDLYKAATGWRDFYYIVALPDDPSAIDQVDSSSLQGGDRGRLILHNGQILILRGDKVYTLQGQEVR